MKKLFFAASATLLLATGCSTMPDPNMSSGKDMSDMSKHMTMSTMMMKMDTDNDGTLSKEEFMKGHEGMFDRMKGPNGTIALKDMPMKDNSMMGMMMKMDTDNDGTISKEEFMKGHEAMFERMKGPSGTILLKEMH